MTDQPAQHHFDRKEWEEDSFRSVEVQSCSKTQTIQIGVHDNTGDFHGENPTSVALTVSDGEALARWIMERSVIIRAHSS